MANTLPPVHPSSPTLCLNKSDLSVLLVQFGSKMSAHKMEYRQHGNGRLYGTRAMITKSRFVPLLVAGEDRDLLPAGAPYAQIFDDDEATTPYAEYAFPLAWFRQMRNVNFDFSERGCASLRLLRDEDNVTAVVWSAATSTKHRRASVPGHDEEAVFPPAKKARISPDVVGPLASPWLPSPAIASDALALTVFGIPLCSTLLAQLVGIAATTTTEEGGGEDAEEPGEGESDAMPAVAVRGGTEEALWVRLLYLSLCHLVQLADTLADAIRDMGTHRPQLKHLYDEHMAPFPRENRLNFRLAHSHFGDFYMNFQPAADDTHGQNSRRAMDAAVAAYLPHAARTALLARAFWHYIAWLDEDIAHHVSWIAANPSLYAAFVRRVHALGPRVLPPLQTCECGRPVYVGTGAPFAACYHECAVLRGKCPDCLARGAVARLGDAAADSRNIVFSGINSALNTRDDAMAVGVLMAIEAPNYRHFVCARCAGE